MSLRGQRGYLLVTVVVTLFLVATIAMLLANDSANSANTTSRGLEAARADYVARAGVQHALWRAQNNACMGDLTIPDTALGTDSYTANISGAAGANLVTAVADQDAWIRSDDPGVNNGKTLSNHVRNEGGAIEQVLTRFDVSSISPKAQISSAIAWFHLESGQTHPQGPLTIHEITADWNETTVTWDSFSAAYASAVIGVIPAQDTGDVWVAVNLTAQVQAWVNGYPNYGILFKSSDEGIHTQYTAREDASNPPRLDVVVGSGAASPVSIKVKGTLDTGLSRNANDKLALAYQPPAGTMLQPDPARIDDTWITAGQTGWNYGAHGTLRVDPGNQRTFIRFDLDGAVPRGALVTSATLELYAYDVNTSGAIDLHRVARSWAEGSCFGTCAADDGVTWDTFDGTNAWTTPGGDIETVPAATTTPTIANTWVAWDVTDLAADWVSGATDNHGVQIRGNPGRAAFYSSDEADAALRPRLTIEYACECGSACLAPQGSGNILMVVEEKTWLGDADAALKDLFDAWGYTVTLISDHDNQNTFDGRFAANDVVFVAESVDVTKVGSKLNDATVGIVNSEGWLNDELGFESADSSNWPVGGSIDVTDTSHYITAPFAAGTLEIYDANMGGLAIGGTKAPGLQALAEWPSGTALATLDTGAMTAAGSTAPGRRVMLPFGRDPSMNWPMVNGNGLLVLQRSLEWAMGLGDTLRILFVVGISDSLQTRDTDRRDLFESWGHTVTIIDDGAAQAEFDAELAINDVVYVGGTVVAGNLDTKLNAATIGIVNEVAGQLDDFGFHGNATASTVSSNKFTATDAGHYITEPFAGGPVTHFTTSLTMPVATAPRAPGLREVADAGVTTGAIAALATGAERWDNAPSPGRRVHLPFGEAEISQLTVDGTTLLRRALEWGGGAGSAGLGKILLVVGDSASPAARDTDRRDLFQSWGYTVEVIDDGASETDFKTALDDTDVIYVSGTVSAGGNLPNLSELPTPIVNEDWYLVADYGFSENEAIATSGNTLTTDEPHYINQPFGGADVTLFSSNISMLVLSGTMSADLMHPGRIAGTATVLGAIAQDDQLWDGSPAAGRRVQVPFAESEIGNLTADGQTLLKRSIEWAAGAGCDKMVPLLFVVSDDATPTTQEVARKDLLASMCFGARLIDDGATQTEYDDAIALADVVYVSSEASSSSIGSKLKARTTGIVNEDPDLHDDFGFSTVRYRAATNAPLTTVATHYITSPFGGSNITLYTSDQQSGAAVGTLPSGLVAIGDWSSGALSPLDGLLTLDTGAAISGGGTAAGRRVQLPWDGEEGGTVADIDALTDDGRTVLQRSLEWAAGLESATGPIAHWKFDETSGTTASDSEGGHDGTLAGDASWAPGVVGGSLSLDGTGDRVVVNGLIDSPQSLTIAAWVNLSSTDFYGAEVIDLGDNILMRLDNGFYDTYVSFWDGSSWQRTRTGQFIAGSGWRHVAYTHDDAANQQFFYIDGAEAGATTFSTSISYSHGTNTAIGAKSQGNSNYDFNGQIDDLRIYDVALSAAEVAELAAMGGGGGGGGGGGAGCDGTFRDNFDARAWNGSNGSLSWATDWIAVGESDGPTAGDIQVMNDQSNYQLRTRDNDNGGEGVEREVDLSGAAMATLNYDYRRMNLDNANDYTSVEISANGASGPWVELARHSGSGNDSSYQPASHPITAHISANTRVRFKTSSTMGNTDTVWFDNIEITCAP